MLQPARRFMTKVKHLLVSLTLIFHMSLTGDAQLESSSAVTNNPFQNIFEDDRIKALIPSGWTSERAITPVYGAKDSVVDEQTIGAVLKNGNYRLYLLTHKSQTSGIIGGRFAEVVSYVSPWLANDPDILANNCIGYTQNQTTPVNRKLSRVDMYFNPANVEKKSRQRASEQCGRPTKQGDLWYGSYFTEPCPANGQPTSQRDRGCGGYFLFYENISGKAPQQYQDWEMVYALTYNTNSPNGLPLKGDPTLRQVMQEANDIINSIKYK
jgi:hypothetical protein